MSHEPIMLALFFVAVFTATLVCLMGHTVIRISKTLDFIADELRRRQ